MRNVKLYNIKNIGRGGLKQIKKHIRHLHRSHSKRYVGKRLVFVQSHLLLAIFVSYLVFSTVAPLLTVSRYQLSDQTREIVGASWDVHKDYMKFDSQIDGYVFDTLSLLGESQQGDSNAGTVKGAYNAAFPKDSNQGITVSDNISKIDLKLTPRFKTLSGELKDGHMIYPLAQQDAQLVYSFKYNGLKEDIILPQFTKDELSFAFDLELPSGLEARLEKSGEIGIYSADSALFGNISYGNDNDKELVEKAKKNSDKNHKIFTIPAPIIKDSDGKTYQDAASFELRDGLLTIRAWSLKDMKYPIAVDPTITVTSAGDFARAKLEHNIDIDETNGYITRAPITGGNIDSWSSETDLGTSQERHSAAATVYNDMLYVSGGAGTSAITTDVRMATVDSTDGSIGTFSATTSFPGSGRRGHYMEAYNGYIYVYGGAGLASASDLETYYAPINPDGTVGTWVVGPDLARETCYGDSFVYNSRLYAVNECTTDIANDGHSIQYANLAANGSIGTWGFTTDYPGQNYGQGVAEYEGRIYISGGYSPRVGTPREENRVWSAPIDPVTGSIGTFVSENNMPQRKGGHRMVAHRGYMYVMAGCDTIGWPNPFSNPLYFPCTGQQNTSYYAQILANGRLGSWVQTTDAPVSVNFWSAWAQSDDYFYMIGGCRNNAGDNDPDTYFGSCNNSGPSAYTKVVQRAVIAPAGEAALPIDDDNITARTELASVVMNGYLYVIGGCTSTGNQCTTSSTLVQRATIGSDGSIGAYTTTSINALPAARGRLAATVYDNTIYVVGGCSGTNCGTIATNTYYVKPASDGTIPAWSNDTTGALNVGRYYHNVVAHNGYIYAIGGYDGASAQTSVEYAAVNSGGDLAAWGSTTSGTPNARIGAASAIFGNKLFVTGGRTAFTGGSLYDSIDYATFESGGDITSWGTDSSNPFSTARFGHTAQILNGYLYIIAGNSGTSSGSTERSDIQFAPIDVTSVSNPVGSFSTSTRTITTAKTYVTSAASSGTIYVVGGCATYDETNSRCSGSINNDTRTINLNNGGSGLNNTSTQDTDKFTSRSDHVSLAYNGYIYVIGGCADDPCTDAGLVSSVQYATILDGGQVSAWSTATQSPSTRRSATGFVANGRLYLLGGCTNTSCSTADLSAQYVVPDSNGNITTAWTTQSSAIGSKWIGVDVAYYDGYVYHAGGSVADAYTTATEMASVDTVTGAIGTWSTEDSISAGVVYNQTVANHGYLYALGGITSGGTLLNSVQYAQIDPVTHQISAWSHTTGFNIQRYVFVAEAYNGYMFIAGGFANIGTGTALMADTQQASIAEDGTLSAWVSGRNLAQVTYRHSGTTYNGVFYVTGGSLGSATYDDLEYMVIDTQPRAGSFTWMFDFDRDVLPNIIAAAGFMQGAPNFLLGFVHAMAPTSTSTYATSQTAFNASHSASLTRVSGMSGARYLHVQFRFGNLPQDGVYPDKPVNINSFSVYFTPDPNRRLRNGRTFTEERNEFYNKPDLNRGL